MIMVSLQFCIQYGGAVKLFTDFLLFALILIDALCFVHYMLIFGVVSLKTCLIVLFACFVCFWCILFSNILQEAGKLLNMS